MFGNGNAGYQEQKAFIQKEIIDKDLEGIVLTNNAQSRLANYQLGFKDQKLKFYSYEAIESLDLSSFDKKYLLLNAFSCELNGTPWDKLPRYVQEHRKQMTELAIDPSSRLYHLNEEIMYQHPLPAPQK